MLGLPKNQFSLTPIALSTSGHAENKFLSTVAGAMVGASLFLGQNGISEEQIPENASPKVRIERFAYKSNTGINSDRYFIPYQNIYTYLSFESGANNKVKGVEWEIMLPEGFNALSPIKYPKPWYNDPSYALTNDFFNGATMETNYVGGLGVAKGKRMIKDSEKGRSGKGLLAAYVIDSDLEQPYGNYTIKVKGKAFMEDGSEREIPPMPLTLRIDSPGIIGSVYLKQKAMIFIDYEKPLQGEESGLMRLAIPKFFKRLAIQEGDNIEGPYKTIINNSMSNTIPNTNPLLYGLFETNVPANKPSGFYRAVEAQ